MLKKKIRRILFRHRADSDAFIEHLKKHGMKVGKGTHIYDTKSVLIDVTRPHLIEIGDNVQITKGVTILTHGYDWSVIKNKYGDVTGSAGKVTIGNNVFIGVHSTILKGVTIGDNVIIGANSLVNKDCLEEGVYAGNPAKFIMSLERYYEKRKDERIDEAYSQCKCHLEQNDPPKKEIFREFFFLFESWENAIKNPVFDQVIGLTGNYEQSLEFIKNFDRPFKNYDEFMTYCKDRYEKEIQQD